MSRQIAKVLLLAAAISIITIVVHWPSIRGGFLSGMDDDAFLQTASQWRTVWDGVRWALEETQFFWTPLSRLSHVITYEVWGPNPAGHHAINIVLHGVNAGLVVYVMWVLLDAISMRTLQNQLALVGGIGLVFGIHPLQIESVAWVSGRITMLCSVFALGSLCTYFHYVKAERPRRLWWATQILFLCALVTKPIAIVLPLVMLVLDYYPLQRHRRLGWRRLCYEKTFLMISSLAMALIVSTTEGKMGWVAGLEKLGLADRYLLASHNICFYVRNLLWPVGLAPFHPFENRINVASTAYIFPAIAVTITTVFCIWRRNKTPILYSAWIVFLVLIAPTSGLAQRGGAAIANRYMYLSILPLLLLEAAAVVWISRKVSQVGRWLVTLLLISYMVFLMRTTEAQISYWHDDETLWKTVVSSYPSSFMANQNVISGLVERHQFAEALRYAESAQKLDPHNPYYENTICFLHCRMADDLAQQQRFVELEKSAHQAILRHPESPYGHAALGVVLLRTARLQDAEMALLRSLRIAPNQPDVRYNLACAYSRLGRLTEAYDILRELLPQHSRYKRKASCDLDLANLRDAPEYAGPFWGLLAEIQTAR